VQKIRKKTSDTGGGDLSCGRSLADSGGAVSKGGTVRWNSPQRSRQGSRAGRGHGEDIHHGLLPKVVEEKSVAAGRVNKGDAAQ